MDTWDKDPNSIAIDNKIISFNVNNFKIFLKSPLKNCYEDLCPYLNSN